MSEEKMREALIDAFMAGNQHGHNSTVDGYWSEAEDVAEKYADEALAQQPASGVELTDAEIYESYADGAGLFNRRIPFTEQEIRGLRAVIAAHEAKRNGGGV